MSPEEIALLRGHTEHGTIDRADAIALLDALEAAEAKATKFATRLADGARNGNEALNAMAHEVTRLREGIAALPHAKGVYVDSEHGVETLHRLLEPPP